MTVSEQARLFGAMALCGAGLGAAYDVLGALGALAGGGRGMRHALDLLFGLFCAGAMIAAGLRMRQDPFRLYAFAGVGAGFAVYMTTLGRIVRCLQRIVRCLNRKLHNFCQKKLKFVR